MKTCIIIDDEINAREALQKIIKRYFNDKLEVLSLADSVQSGVEVIKKYRPEIVFLDIEMPEENGFELFKYFEGANFHIVFTTAYDQYAISAIKHSAIDYLLKPINHIELRETLQRIEKLEYAKLNTANKIEEFLNNFNVEAKEFNKIALPTNNGYIFEKLRNIIYCKSDGSYTKIYIVNKAPFLISTSLKETEKLFPKNLFFRVHKSYLVNLNYVKSFNKTNGYKVILETGDILPVSSRKSKEFIDLIKK